MKRLLLCLVILCALATQSCKKTYCWKCTLYGPNSKGNGLNLNNPKTESQCDKTEAEIRAYENANTQTITVFNGNNNQTNYVREAKCTQE